MVKRKSDARDSNDEEFFDDASDNSTKVERTRRVCPFPYQLIIWNQSCIGTFTLISKL